MHIHKEASNSEKTEHKNKDKEPGKKGAPHKVDPKDRDESDEADDSDAAVNGGNQNPRFNRNIMNFGLNKHLFTFFM